MAEERVHIEIGFRGGQTIGAVTHDRAVAELETALADGAERGAFALEAEDGTYVIPLAAVAYLKRFSRETRIGFGRAD